jgi:hypothetical protein
MFMISAGRAILLNKVLLPLPLLGVLADKSVVARSDAIRLDFCAEFAVEFGLEALLVRGLAPLGGPCDVMVFRCRVGNGR